MKKFLKQELDEMELIIINQIKKGNHYIASSLFIMYKNSEGSKSLKELRSEATK